MPNKNYRKGVRKEYKIVNREKARGRLSFRSAGSHSPVDVVSVDFVHRLIKFIQSKPDSMSDNAKRKLEMENRHLNGCFECIFVVE